MRPLLKIQGSKVRISDWIVNNIKERWNDEGIYFEPFMGCGIVGFKLLPQKAVFSDLNPDIIEFFKYIQKNDIKDIANALNEHGFYLKEQGEPYYYQIREQFNETKTTPDFIFLNRTCFNGVMRYNNKGHFNTPYCKNDNKLHPDYLSNITLEISKFQSLAKEHNWLFVCKSYLDVFPKIKDCDFVYNDPPYADRENQYLSGWEHNDEKAFHKAVRGLKCKWAVSSWKESYINKHVRTNKYMKYWEKDYAIKTQNHQYGVGPDSKTRPKVTEVLIESS
tara:strand:- start:921 stop:1754 length:834 start_codon:yes stop_codon:yes gene_type:complete